MCSTEDESDKLKIFWNYFFKAETGTYEKSTWLELFLAEFLIRLNDGANPKDLITFCPISGVVSLVGCELLCGIHRVTSSIKSHYPLPLEASTSSEDNKVDDEAKPSGLFSRANAQSSEEILAKYLGGVAWRCLVLLKTLGVEGVSCCRQLSSVLIWLGELSGGLTIYNQSRSDIQIPVVQPKQEIYDLFSSRIWTKQRIAGHPVSKVDTSPVTDRGTNSDRSLRLGQVRHDTPKRKPEHSSESVDSDTDLQVLNRTLTIKISTPDNDFEYFTSPSRDRYDDVSYDEYIAHKRAKPKAEDYTTDRHRAIINSEISLYQFTLITTDLLQELCKTESSFSGSEGSQISFQCINFALRNLCSLQFGSLPVNVQQYNPEQISQIKVSLTELLIVSLDKVLLRTDLCAKLIQNGILPKLLRLLEDIVCKSNKKYTEKPLTDVIDKNISEDFLKYIFGIAFSITAFFHCLLMQCRSVDKLREFADQFRLYSESLKGLLFKESIELMIRLPGQQKTSLTLIKKLIEGIGKLICGMKRVRSEVIHSAACPKTRHKVCRARVSAGMHHHHDILGDSKHSLSHSSCCISVLYATLTSLLIDDEIAGQSALRNKILLVMLNSGVCCCYSTGHLMENVVRLMLTQSNCAPLCLRLLEHTVYGELGASVLAPKVTDQLPCAICEPSEGHVKKFYTVSTEKNVLWSFLIHYNTLLQCDNSNSVLHCTVDHLLRVTPKCRMDMKYELLFSVIYPTFIVSKHRYMIRLEESAYFLTVSCLNIFASLLNTVSFAEQFILKGGLSYVLELVSLSEFSKQCCSILEIAIVVEIFKLIKENNSDMSYRRDLNTLASVQMLIKSLADMNEKCMKIYQIKFSEEVYDKLIDLKTERETFAIHDKEVDSVRKASEPQNIKTSYAMSETSREESMENYLEVLRNVYTFWKSCASLCLYSPMFREHLVKDNVFIESYGLLKLLLYYLFKCDCGAAECRIVIKIVEALLTVQFAVSDVTSGRSKGVSCDVIRAGVICDDRREIAGEEGGQNGGESVLRPLCEALIRVATAAPSDHHTMPPINDLKSPQIHDSEVSGSTPERSSSEESVAGVYESENSGNNTDKNGTTDGYEADVEVSKLEQQLSYDSRKLTSINGKMASVLETCSYDSGFECGEYVRTGAVVHPELCIIVVDILSQLIKKLLEVSTSASMRSMGAASRVARACCGRLGAALAVRCPPPPRLLARLLDAAAVTLLTQNDTHLQELQSSVLDLIHVIGTQSIEPCELESLLKLFRSSKQVPHALLGALARLANACAPFTPQAILSFPVRRINNADGMMSLTDEMKHLTLNTTTSQSHQAEAMARNLHEQHTKAGISSCWRWCGSWCGVEGAGWAPWVHGLAATLWLRPHHPPQHTDTVDEWNDCSDSTAGDNGSAKCSGSGAARPAPLSHVFSIGYDSLMFEIWMDTATGTLTLRLTRPDPTCDQVLSTAQVETRLPHHSWTCLGFNVKELLHKRKIFLQVTIFMNGYETETISLPFQGIMVRKLGPVCVLVGASGGGAWHAASLCVLRAPVLTSASALHLAAYGPDAPPLHTQMETQSPNYPVILTRDIIESNIDWDQVYDMSNHIIRELQDKLLLTFSAHAPAIMNLYHPTTALPTVFPSRVGTASSLMASSTLSGKASSSGASSIPETLFVSWTALPQTSRHSGLPPAVYMLGGPDVILFLYARIVELDGTPEEQAMALSILLRVCRVDNQLFSMFYNDDSLNMLHTVFASPKCKLGLHSLKALLDAACNTPVISSGFVVNCRTDAFIVEPRLIVTIVRAWTQLDAVKDCTWDEDIGGTTRSRRGSAWTCALACVRALMHDHHPSRHHNHYHLNHHNLLEHLLRACKERFLNSDYCGCLEPDASAHFVEIVRGLMGTPPLPHHLALLSDFLILMHQARDTFVTHSRANFYFLLTPETQETSEFNFLDIFRKRKYRRSNSNRSQSNNDSTTTRSTTPSIKSEDFNETSLVKEPDQKSDEHEDNEKQYKGMINQQIKEGRKYNISSSTSENSDFACVEESRPGENFVIESRSEEGPLSEYVVVDVGDIATTTVEMCESGIYHQRVVRAGATPGWAACEGLLLLLRDAVIVLPEHALAQVVGVVIQPESLVVLGNHREPSVRAALVRVVSALQRRSPAALAKLNQYYVHLANQISLYPGSWELATACAALLTKCDVPLEDQLDEEIWMDVSEQCGVRAPPLLAVLVASLDNVPLAHKVMLILANLIDKASLKVLNEIGLAEVVTKCVGAAGDLELDDGKALLLEDLTQLLIILVIKALSSQYHMQTVYEIHYMLTFVESNCTGGGRVAAREAQCALYRAQIQYLDQKLHHNYNKQHYFTTVLVSGVGESVREGEGRVRGAVSRAVALLCRAVTPTLADVRLADLLLNTLLHGCNTSGARKAWWLGGESSEWAPLLLDLSWWMLSSENVQLPATFLRITYHHQHHFSLDHNSQRKMAVYLLSALQRIHAAGVEGGSPLELAITDWARGLAVVLQSSLPDRIHSDTLHEEAARMARHDRDRWMRQAAQHGPHIVKAVWNKESLANKITESAMSMTRKVNDLQNNERKAFMEHLRRAQSESVASSQRWNRLIETYTHEQALWHDPESYPQSWQLDSTEGPGRIRVRLRRTHLHIDQRYFKSSHKHKAVTCSLEAPLRSVVSGSGSTGGVQRGLVSRLQLNETVGYMARVTHVTVDCDTRGELLLSDRSIHFVPEDADGEMESSTMSSKSREKIVVTCSGCETHTTGALSWPLQIVREVVTRRWCLQERAVELMLSTGHAQLLAFSDSTERAAFLQELATVLPTKPEPDSLTEAMNLWRQGAITNWEYLMRLNGLAGRTYNDLMQYPVLPFVIADYSSRILDLNDPASFRKLAKPMAIQNKNREQHYINTYNDLKAARRDGSGSLLSRQPHHYASLYSNSGAVLHYMVRVPPFTQLLLNYQDNNFDMPDRTFHSLATTWRLITNDSPTDVKEMIPELYYLPEMFNNNEGLNLGVRQCGIPVEGVELPPWAADARLFTLIQRQALESPHVTEMLPHWIDLVFGCKQTGQAAIDAINVFPACTYYGFDPSALEDEVDRTAAEAMVRTYGQAPRQLLKNPHPLPHTDLAPTPVTQREVVSGVEGARWGSYCGSVSAAAPLEVQRRVVPLARRLLPLAHGRSVALLAHNQILISLFGTNANSLTPSGTSATSSSTSTLALISWGHSDGVVRLKRRRDSRPDLLLHIPPYDQISCVSSCVGVSGCPVALGLVSGRVWAVVPGDRLRPRLCPLVGHRAAVTAAHVSAPAATLLTAAADGTVILWDLHRLTYIRTLPNRDMLPVTHATISDTLCDVATVHDLSVKPTTDRKPRNTSESEAFCDGYENDTDNYQSLIRVHTVNGSYVGSVKVVEKVTCICYSNAPEGISVNSIAAGLDSGAIRLYSSWDLRPTTYIPPPSSFPRVPLISICYSSDSSLLFGCYEDGGFVAWENGGGGVKPAPIRILTAQAMF